MKIIHGTDYYDNAHGGIDPDIIFVRDGKMDAIDIMSCPTRPTGVIRAPFFTNETLECRYHNLQLGWALCAGEIYPFMRDIEHIGDSQSPRLVISDEFIDTRTWNKYDYVRHKTSYYYDVDESITLAKTYGFTKNDSRWQSNEIDIRDHFATSYTKMTDWLINNKIVTGCIYYDYDKMILIANDAGMKDLHFYKVMDAYTMNQTIAGYIGGVLTNSGNKMVEISDTHKIMKAGFDTKSSFRKGPTKKK